MGVMGFASAGCVTTERPLTRDELTERAEAQGRPFGDFDLPRRIGTVENIGLQLPVVSPAGDALIYQRSDRLGLPRMTLLGSSDHTPSEGELSLWLRPLAGRAPGRRISSHRWAHSGLWSPSGQAVLYVANEPPSSLLIHHDLASGQEHELGLPGAINCMPRFDGNDETVLFCAGEKAEGPFRVYRQALGETRPEPLTPKGMDCVLPLMSGEGGAVICAHPQGSEMVWVTADVNGVTTLTSQRGAPHRALLLQTWAGIAEPLSSDRDSFLFCEILNAGPTARAEGRIAVYCFSQRWTRRIERDPDNPWAGVELHSIAACWMDNDVVALATPENTFVHNTKNMVLTQVLNKPWIPARYIPTLRTLVLLGAEMGGRLAIWEVRFRVRA